MPSQSVNQTQQQTSTTHPLSTGGILQRQCLTCGQHTIAGDTCPECEKQQYLLERSPSTSPNIAVPPVAPTPTGGFNHDISRVPVRRSSLPFPIQAKLTVGEPGDKYEQEADQVADQVMRMPDLALSGGKALTQPSSPLTIQRITPVNGENLRRQYEAKEEDEDEEKKSIQRKEMTSSSLQLLTDAPAEMLQRQPIEMEKEEEDEEEKLIGTAQTKALPGFSIQPVTSMAERTLQRQYEEVAEEKEEWVQAKLISDSGMPVIQRQEAEEEEEEKTTQAKESAGRTPFYKLKNRLYVVDHENTAKYLSDILKSYGSFEEIISALNPYKGKFGQIQNLKEAYKQKTAASSIDALEIDLSNYMTMYMRQEELDYIMKILHEPIKPKKGIPAMLLAEAEQQPRPKGPCSAVTLKRYVRACLNQRLNQEFYKAKNLHSRRPNNELLAQLTYVLEDQELASNFLNNGPKTRWTGTPVERKRKKQHFASVMKRTLEKIGLGDEAETFYLQWQISELKPQGAVEALHGHSRGRKRQSPVNNLSNLKPYIWNEILEPGDVIQTWSTSEAVKNIAKNLGCRGAPSFGGSCGHSFIFVEYVYSLDESPSKSALRFWILYGSSGTPLNTGGKVISHWKYTVQKGDSLERIGQKFGVEVEKIKEHNPPPKLKTWSRKNGEIVEGFNKGAEIIIGSASSLLEMRDLHLVGMRVVDQHGYYFIPKNLDYIKPSVLPRARVGKAKWLAKSEVWFAAHIKSG